MDNEVLNVKIQFIFPKLVIDLNGIEFSHQLETNWLFSKLLLINVTRLFYCKRIYFSIATSKNRFTSQWGHVD